MKKKLTAIAGATALIFSLAACGGGGGKAFSAEEAGAKNAGDAIVVGSANFSENVVLGHMYASALKAGGFDVNTKLNIGSREIIFREMEKGSIDVLPEYNGALLAHLDSKDKSTDTESVNTAIKKHLPSNLGILESSDAQNNNVVVVSGETAAKHSLSTLSDLAPSAGDMVFGAAPEDKTRFQGIVGLRDVYGLNFKEFKSLDQAGPLTITALKGGDIDAAILYSTTPEIEKEGFVALDDPEHIFGVQNVTPLITTAKVPAEAQAILNEISKKLDTATLTGLNAKVLMDRMDPDVVANEWLKENGFMD